MLLLSDATCSMHEDCEGLSQSISIVSAIAMADGNGNGIGTGNVGDDR